MRDICGHDCQASPVTQTETDWVEEQVGEIWVNVGKLVEPVLGFKDYIGTVKIDNAGMYVQVLLGPEYGEVETHEITQMVGRVLRAHFVRTRLLPLLGDLGVAH